MPRMLIVFWALSVSATGHAQTKPTNASDSPSSIEVLDEFRELLALPNASADRDNVRRNATWIAERFRRRGFAAEVWEVPGANPVVFAERPVPGATRTLIFYAHYDGQPVNPARWTSPPWSPTLYSRALEEGGQKIDWPVEGQAIDPESRIYARSAGDDKAPIIAMLAALDKLKNSRRSPVCNLKFVFDGEEEIGSPNLARYLERYRTQLDGDVWLFCDGPVHQSRRPQLVFGVRGITQLELTVYGANRNLHSGHYGNWAPNPAMRLARLLASMKDDHGRVLVDGFYDSVEPLSDEGRKALDALPPVDEGLLEQFALASRENPDWNYEQSLLVPSLNVRGLESATVGATARNLVPDRAIATIDMRLVMGNDPRAMVELVKTHIRKQGYTIVSAEPDTATRRKSPRLVKVTSGAGMPAARTPIDVPIVKPIIEATRRAAGQDVLLVPTLGGTLPLYLFTAGLNKPVVIVPIANHDNNQHGPNENLRLANLWYGIDLMVELFCINKE